MSDILTDDGGSTALSPAFDPAAMFDAAVPMRAAMMVWAGAFAAIYVTCAIAMNYAASR